MTHGAEGRGREGALGLGPKPLEGLRPGGGRQQGKDIPGRIAEVRV